MELILIYALIAIGAYFIWRYRERRRTRQEQAELLRGKMAEITSAVAEFQQHLKHENGFFSNNQLNSWKEKHFSLYQSVQELSSNSPILSPEEKTSLEAIQSYFRDGEHHRTQYNNAFAEQELKDYDAFFSNVEGRKLDLQQRTAIITDEDNNLVIAGAGSGKTTTIVGKVRYILDRYRAKPSEILLISFTKNSASTLASRINVEGIEARTFHKLGKDIIVACEKKQPSIFDEAQFRPLLDRTMKDLMKQDLYMEQLTDYFANYLKPAKSQFEFKDQGEYIQYLKDQNFKTYKAKAITRNGKLTYRMEVVKSVEECRIANFLYFNNISYEYEYPYEVATVTENHRQYKPDFTITQGDKKVYLEHFGINREGEVPNWFERDGDRTASEKYTADMDWKRNVHRENGTVLMESYSYEMSEGILFENLTRNLENAGFTLKPKTPEEIWSLISEVASDEVSTFLTLIQTFITLMKSNNLTIRDLIGKNSNNHDAYIRTRNNHFLQLIEPIYQRYQAHLTERGEIEFSDMINKAADYVAAGQFERKISHIIIDEFQDISIGRYKLIKAIKEQNPACKLFCVGDDWQSIYRFSGSDLALFKDYEQYFGFTVRSRIETTYRFHDPVIRLSSHFILKNPNQTKKALKSASVMKKTNYEVIYSSSDNQDDTQALQNIFNELITSVRDIEKKEVLILGRYGMDIDRIRNDGSVFRIDRNSQTLSYSARLDIGSSVATKTIQAQFMTVHKSKGLEGDIVIILNCNSGKMGFPSEMSDDRVLDLLLSEADQFANGEERRLFYVAMTRAREKVYFIADESYKSKFIMELENNGLVSNANKCPKCKTADVMLMKTGVAKNGNSYKFYGCMNYAYGCYYSKTEWVKNSTFT